jgi:pyruvate/2-oxoglutarate dehydrogenase complex dihydrolipoamide dehydrogenase (E3) component
VGSNVDYIPGTGSFVTSKIVEVDQGETKERYSADHILIASGSSPPVETFVGNEHCWSSDDVFTME